MPIHNILKAIDNHTALFLATGNPWHEQQAATLRQYVHGLKTYIHAEEANNARSSTQQHLP